MTGDGGEGNRIGPFKGRTAAVGATAGYNFTVAGTPVSARIKVLREVDVENRPQGTIGLFTVAFPLGGHADAAPAQPIRVRYQRGRVRRAGSPSPGCAAGNLVWSVSHRNRGKK